MYSDNAFLNRDISTAPLIGPSLKGLFNNLDIYCIRDLLYHVPARYEDRSRILPIALGLNGQIVTVIGKVITAVNLQTRRGFTLSKAIIADDSARLELLWFNQPFMVANLKPDSMVYASGIITRGPTGLVMKNPEIELFYPSRPPIHTGRLVPIYPETRGISSKRIRAVLSRLLPEINLEDPLPIEILEKHGLENLNSSLHQIHFPQNEEGSLKARRRLAFDELLNLKIKSLIMKKQWQSAGSATPIPSPSLDDYKAALPFTLTSAQEQAIQEIFQDIAQAIPMNRLLEGDVGSGKTVVAGAAIHAALKSGLKSVVLAPTEILAQQHFVTLNSIFNLPAGEISLHTGATKTVSEETKIIIGTHALLFDQISLTQVGLIVIDEQHRFGVSQRSKLIEKARDKNLPHVLSMTATPIPRTLALTVHGDLSLSIMDQLPPNRKIVKTKVVNSKDREKAMQWIYQQVKSNNDQAYVICPLISESDKINAKAVLKEFDLWHEKFPDVAMGLLHGQLSSKQKHAELEKFRVGETKILITTSVIEVGVDVPQATIMVIEGAERFGLAALHQLRGRVGRGEKNSYCFLMNEERGQNAALRLKAMESCHNGFELAEIDLKTRGPGEIFGVAQSGIPTLKVADLSDSVLIGEVHEVAQQLFNDFSDTDLLAKKFNLESVVKPN